MKIQDAENAFDFLSKLDWYGIIGLIIGVSLVVAFLVAGIVDKLYENKKVKRIIILAVIFFVILCICILKSEANRNYKFLYKANNIKEYMIEHGELSCGFNELATSVYFPYESPVITKEDIEIRKDEILNVIQLFPDEFKPSGVSYPNNPDDVTGISLINSKTIQPLVSGKEKLYPLFKGKILNYMKGKLWDTLNYRFIRDMLDDRCDDHTLDMLISKNSNLFISIYSFHNIYESRDPENKSGITYALRINPDSIKRIFGSQKLRYMKIHHNVSIH
jgi:hypothetical protein